MLKKLQYSAQVGALLIICSPGGAVTQEAGDLIPLSEWSNLPEERKNYSYPFIRCAALLTAIAEYGGASLPDEDVETADETVRNLLTFSVMIRLEKNPDLNLREVAKRHDAERFAISDIYRSRLDENMRTSGEAIASDVFLVSELELCGVFVRMLP